MPEFKQIPVEQQKAQKGISQEIVDEYKRYIQDLNKGHVGLLEFGKTEDIELARKALEQAGEELRNYVRIRRRRGERILQFQRITQREWQQKKKRDRARAVKTRNSRVSSAK